MIPFAAPVDDILFSLRHVADVARLPDWDGELAEGIITHFASFAEGVIAPLDEPAMPKAAVWKMAVCGCPMALEMPLPNWPKVAGRA